MIGLPRQWWESPHRILTDVPLLPLALLFVVLEDVVWRGARALLARLVRLPAIAATRMVLGRLPGWAALPLFLIPEVGGRFGEAWAGVLLYRGNAVRAVLAYALVHAAGTLAVVFIWQSCGAALLKLRWFARLATLAEAARDWADARSAPLRAVARRLIARRRGHLTYRMRTLRVGLRSRFGLARQRAS